MIALSIITLHLGWNNQPSTVMIPPRCMKLSLDSTVFPRIIAGRVDQIPFQLDREGINEREDGERGGGDYLRDGSYSRKYGT